MSDDTEMVEYPDVEAQNIEEGRDLPDPDSQDWKPDLAPEEVEALG